MSSYRYNDLFFNFVDNSSGSSAKLFINSIDFGYKIKSVLDVGCGRGIWLNAWSEKGVELIKGIDGDYINPETLKIPLNTFESIDISEYFDLNSRFDLVECLEVAEHIPKETSKILVENLIRHGDVILFSAAPIGQGGENHINEQPIEYWKSIFQEFGYKAYDYPRHAVQGMKSIEPWYRYNTILYVNSSGEKKISDNVKSFEIKKGERVKDFASLFWQMRCKLIGLFPHKAVNFLAVFKHFVMTIVKK